MSAPAPSTQPQQRILPLELIDKAIGSRLWILLRGHTELTGILRGFDDYVNLVLDDAVEYTLDTNTKKYRKKSLDCEILLNGNQIAALVPGGDGPPADMLIS